MPAGERLSSTTETAKICERKNNILRGNLFHLTKSQVLIARNGMCHHISLNKGIEAQEPTCFGKFWKKHPSLPLLFAYPNSPSCSKTGELMVTSDVTHQDDVSDRVTVPSYNADLDCIAKTSSRKRLFCTDQDGAKKRLREEEEEKENFVE